MTTSQAQFDQKAFRHVMGNYPTGVAVVTTTAPDGELLALVVGTFSSVSLEPPLVSFMPMKTSRTFAKMRDCDTLTINIFGGEQQDEMLAIARRWENKLDGIDWHESPNGNPVLDNALAWIDTTVTEVIEAGDHFIVLCEVEDMLVANPGPPLLFFQGGYGSFVGSTMLSGLRHEALPAIHAAHRAGDELERLADEVGCEVVVYVATSEDEFVTVFAARGPGVSEEDGFSSRLPIVPPIGDTYMYDKPEEVRERWLTKLKDPSEEVRALHEKRLEAVKESGYLLAYFPEEGSAAYSQMVAATKEYQSAVLTPATERAVRELIGSSTVDYDHRDVEANQVYNVASIVFPVTDPSGETTMTLRISQLPQEMPGKQLLGVIQRAKKVIGKIES